MSNCNRGGRTSEWALHLTLVGLAFLSPTSASASGVQRPRVPGGSPGQGSPEQGSPKVELAQGGARWEIAFAGSQILVDGVRVNGEGPFRFLLDTGAMGGGRLDVKTVERLGLEPTGEILAGDGSGRPGRAMKEYRLESLEIDGLRATDVRVLARDYNQFGAAVRGPIDGVLGMALFEDLLLTLDYPGAEIRVESGALPEVDGLEVLPLVEGMPVPTIELEVAGSSIQAAIDSGAMGPLNVPDSIGEGLELLGEGVVVGEARTVSGSFQIREVTLDGTLRIGRHGFFRPKIVVGAPMGFGVLGGDALADFVVTLDSAGERVRFLRGGHPRGDSAPERTILEAPSTEIEVGGEGRWPVVQVRIDGQGPFPMILDTGAGVTVLHRDLAEELGLEVEGETSLGAPTGSGSIAAQEHRLASVSLGSARFEGIRAVSWEDPGMLAALGDVRGVLGFPTFGDLLYSVDLEAGRLVLSHGTLVEGDGSVPFTQRGRGLPTLEIEVGGKAVEAHFDTGNPGGLSLPADWIDSLSLVAQPRSVGRVRTAGGESDLLSAQLEGRVRVAGVDFEDPQLMFMEGLEVANVGGQWLRGRVLEFDSIARRVRLVDREDATQRGSELESGVNPAPGGPRPPEGRRTYGLVLGLAPGRPLDVRGTIPGSVAEAAGVLTGDRILEIDGVDVTTLDGEGLNEAMGREKIRLTLERGEETLTLDLSLGDEV